MKLLNEDLLFESLSGKTFFDFLLEFLNKDSVVGDSRQYIIDRDGVFDKKKESEYVKQFPIDEIKNDIKNFADEWVQEIKALPNVKDVKNTVSPYFGFSDYIQVRFIPSDIDKLDDFYKNHKASYKNCFFRFSDHINRKTPYRDYGGRCIRDQVNYSSMSFIEASKIMKDKIIDYIEILHSKESDYLKSISMVIDDIDSQINLSKDKKLYDSFYSVINQFNKIKNWNKSDSTLFYVFNALLNSGIYCDIDTLKEFFN